jgi:N-acylglucosamine 2-epimerase
MAAAELYLATGEAQYADEAKACLAVYEESCRHAEAPSPAFPARVVYRQLAHPMFRLNVMLVLERCGVGDYGKEMDAAIAEMKLFRDPTTGLVFERRLPSGGIDLDSQDGRFVNPGHSLEGMSFALHRIRKSKNADDLAWALAAVRALGEFAIDPKDGGLGHYRDGLGKPVAKFEAPLKVWWGNCEAASAFLQAYELSGDKWFLDAFCSLDRYNFSHFKDSKSPEWFAYTAPGGRQFHTYKGSRWKTFFHLPRHLFTCIEVVKRMENRK